MFTDNQDINLLKLLVQYGQVEGSSNCREELLDKEICDAEYVAEKFKHPSMNYKLVSTTSITLLTRPFSQTLTSFHQSSQC